MKTVHEVRVHATPTQKMHMGLQAHRCEVHKIEYRIERKTEQVTMLDPAVLRHIIARSMQYVEAIDPQKNLIDIQ